MTSVPSDQ